MIKRTHSFYLLTFHRRMSSPSIVSVEINNLEYVKDLNTYYLTVMKIIIFYCRNFEIYVF